METIEILEAETNLLKNESLRIVVLGSGSPINYFKSIGLQTIDKIEFVELEHIGKEVIHSLSPPVLTASQEKHEKYSKLEELFEENSEELYPAYEYYMQSFPENGLLSKEEFNNKAEFITSSIKKYIEQFDESTEKFDVVILSKVLSHIQTESNTNSLILNSVQKVMKPNAQIFVRVNGKKFPIIERPKNMLDMGTQPLRTYSKKEFKNLMTNFVIESELITKIRKFKIEGKEIDAEEYCLIGKYKPEE